MIPPYLTVLRIKGRRKKYLHKVETNDPKQAAVVASEYWVRKNLDLASGASIQVHRYQRDGQVDPTVLFRLGALALQRLASGQVRYPGQVAAAKENRVRVARASIVGALQQLSDSPCETWPDFVVAFCKNIPSPNYQQPALANPFQAPDFDRLNQSRSEWKKLADQAWQEHRDAFLSGCEFWETTGVDEAIPPTIRIRQPGRAIGRARRRTNSALEQRYLWAAKYLLGRRIKEIAAQNLADPSTVGRIARQILKQAEWSRPGKTKRQATTRA
jgi:hypothetical protein